MLIESVCYHVCIEIIVNGSTHAIIARNLNIATLILQDRFSRATTCTTSCNIICSNTRGSLKVFVRNAWGLPNGNPDPYITVTAVRETSLIRTSRNTHEVKNSKDPTWNKNIWFGCGRWKFIEVSVWDGDGGCDDNLMPARYYPI